MKLADQWVRLAYYFPITWAEYKNMASIERYAIRMAVNDMFEEMSENNKALEHRNDPEF